MLSKTEIDLSVVVTIVGGGAFLSRCLRQLRQHKGTRPIEVIVPYDSTVSDLTSLKEEFPDFAFIGLGNVTTKSAPNTLAAAHELYDRRRAKGLSVAKGAMIAIIEDYIIVAPDWIEQILEARKLGHAVIGGAVEHAGKGTLNWAVFYQDLGRYQRPLTEGPSEYLTDINIAYTREALESVRDLWSERYHEVTVNWALARRGETLWRRPQVVAYHDRGPLRLVPLLRERMAWGRLFAALRAREISTGTRCVYAAACPFIPLLLLARIAGKTGSNRRHAWNFLRALPALCVLTCGWCLGEMVGYVTGRDAPRSKSQTRSNPISERNENSVMLGVVS